MLRSSSFLFLLMLLLLGPCIFAKEEQQAEFFHESIFQQVGLKYPAEHNISHSIKWMARFHEPLTPQQLRKLEPLLSCLFIEIVDGSWLVVAGIDFDIKLRRHDAVASLRLASIVRHPHAASIQIRLLQQLQWRAAVRSEGHFNWIGRQEDIHVLRVLSVPVTRTLFLQDRLRPLHSIMSPLPSHCRIHTLELDRPGHLSVSVFGSWTCVLHAISSLILHPIVLSIDLLPHVKLHNRNSSLLLTNAENSESLVNNDLSWLSSFGLDGTGELIGLADSGIDWDHCAFSPDLPLPLNTVNVSKQKIIAYFAAGLPSGLDFTRSCTQRCGSGDTSDDLEGHGTHVAGTAAGRAPTSLPYSPFNSMAAAARIVFTDIQVSSDSLTIPDDLYSGIFADAYSAGARIHSNSWGCGRAPDDVITTCNVYDSMAADIDRFTWDHEDFLVLVAAGNDGTLGAGTVSTPATCKNCITVGSSEGFYENGVSYEYKPPASWSAPQASNMAEFSSYGSTLPDGRMKPDVVALGLSVRSAASNGFISSLGNCGHSKKSGTSMSTPAVAALIALIRQYYRTSYPAPPLHRSSHHLVGYPSAALLRSALINIARPLQGRYFDGSSKARSNHATSNYSSFIVMSSYTSAHSLLHAEVALVATAQLWQLNRRYEHLAQNFHTRQQFLQRHDEGMFLTFHSSVTLQNHLTLGLKIADSMQGFGRPYLSNLINRPGSPEAAALRQQFVMDISNSEGLASQQYISVTIQLSSALSRARPLSISLAWTDYQGSLTSQKALVNDLDLFVSVGKRNSGSIIVYRGGGGNLPDTTNNAEKVLLAGLADAEDVVIINVSAWSVPSGRQGFALVIVGFFHPASVSVSNPINTQLSQKWNPDHNFIRLYLNVPYVSLVNDLSALHLLQSQVQSSVATLVRCDAACVRLSSIVRDQRLRSSTGCSVDIFFNQCATVNQSLTEQPFLLLLSGYYDPLSIFYQLDGLSSANGLMTPEEVANARALDDSQQTQTDLTVVVVILASLVILLLAVGVVYLILRRMKPKVKVAPAPPGSLPQETVIQTQPAGEERILESSNGLPPPSFTMDMWASEAAVSSEAEALEKALRSQISQGALESILWGYESSIGPRSVPGSVGTNDAVPILASRPQLDRFLSSARALDLLRPIRDSLRRTIRPADDALPQWGTGLPGEVRVLQGEVAERHANDVGEDHDGAFQEDHAVDWGY